jgi:hypothetical protein
MHLPESEGVDPLPRPHSSAARRARLSASLAAAAGLALAAAASSSAGAEAPPKPYDRCAYMNHESKAYQACLAEQAAAKQRADAAPPAVAKPKPNPPPGS